MADSVAARLQALGIELPVLAAPVANYVPSVRQGTVLIVSGQLPLVGGVLCAKGRLGADLSIDVGVSAARACLLNLLAVVQAATGDLERVSRVVRLGGFIACTTEFERHAEVMNGASDLAVAVFGERGRHARSTIGVLSLPLGAPVEVEGSFELAP